MIKGSIIKEYVEDIWGCELIQAKDEMVILKSVK